MCGICALGLVVAGDKWESAISVVLIVAIHALCILGGHNMVINISHQLVRVRIT